jgi:hypothetical protein
LKFHKPEMRQLASTASGIGAGAVAACLLSFAVAHAGSPIILLAYLASVPLVMAGLSGGIIAGALAATVGSLGLLAFEPASFALYFFIAHALPILGFIILAMSARVLRDGSLVWCNEGALLTGLVAYPCVIFLAVFAFSMGHDGGLLAMTTDTLNGVSDQILTLLKDKGEKLSPEMIVQLQHYLTVVARVVPALLMCGWLFSTIGSIVVGQSILVQKKWHVRPAFALENIHVPNWVIYAAAVAGIAANLAPAPYDYAALNVALMTGMPFFFAGLAVVHAWAARGRAPTATLIGFYLILCLFIYLA